MDRKGKCKTIGAGIENYSRQDKPQEPQASGGNKGSIEVRAIFIVWPGSPAGVPESKQTKESSSQISKSRTKGITPSPQVAAAAHKPEGIKRESGRPCEVEQWQSLHST